MKYEIYLAGIFILCWSCIDENKKLGHTEDEKIQSLVFRSKDIYQDDLLKREITDSLLNLVNQQSKSFRQREYLFKVANRYHNLREFDLEKLLSKRIISESIEARDSVSLAKGLEYLGDNYEIQQIPDSAIINYKEAKEIYEIAGNTIKLAEVLLKMSIIKTNRNDLIGGESLALESLVIFKRHEDYKNIAQVYNILGKISYILKDYKQTALMFEKAIEIIRNSESEEKDYYLNLFKHNLGSLLIDDRKYEEAYKIFDGLLSDELYVTNATLYASSISQIATLKHILYPETADVEILFERSISIHDSVSLSGDCIEARNQFAQYYLSIGDSVRAKNILISAYEFPKVDKFDSLLILETLHNLIKTDPQSAAKYSLEYIKLSDSLKLAERQIRDKFERIEYETNELTAELDSERTSKAIYIQIFGVILFIALIIIFLIYKNLESIKKQFANFKEAADKEVYNMLLAQHIKVLEGKIIEKTRISRELHDGILNDLAFVRLSIGMAIEGDNSEGVQKCFAYLSRLQLIENEIHTMSRDLRGTSLNVDSYRTLLNDMIAFQQCCSDVKWHFFQSEDIKWKKIDKVLKVNIYRILQEAMENVHKHATASHASIEINIIDEKLEIVISDNGVGFDKNLKSCGTGLQNIQMRVSIDGGTFDLETDTNAGVKIILVYPI